MFEQQTTLKTVRIVALQQLARDDVIVKSRQLINIRNDRLNSRNISHDF